MLDTARLAGFIAAHGIWCVSEGETLIPLVAFEAEDGERTLRRMVMDDLADGAHAAQEAVAVNEPGARAGVSVVDAYIGLPTGRTDALLVTAVEYAPARRSVTLAVPYRPKDPDRTFAVHRLKLLELDGVPESDQPAFVNAFFVGVHDHEEAAPVWDNHLDESI